MQLSGSIKDDLNNIIILESSSIYNSYMELMNLEIQNKKDSPEFQKTITALKSSIDLTNAIYERFSNDRDSLDAIIKYLSHLENIENSLTITDELVTIINNPENLKEMRTLNNITSLIDKISTKDLQNFQKLLSFKNLGKVILEEFYKLILSFINREMLKQDDAEIKKLLIRYKYLFSYLRKDIENEFLKNNFLVSNEVTLISPFIADLIGMNEEELYEFRSMWIMEELEKNLSYFESLEISSDYAKRYVENFVLMINVRLCFCLFPDNHVENIKKLFPKEYSLDNILKYEDNNYIRKVNLVKDK